MKARAKERMLRSIVSTLKVLGAAALLTPLPQPYRRNRACAQTAEPGGGAP